MFYFPSKKIYLIPTFIRELHEWHQFDAPNFSAIYPFIFTSGQL
ncbi:MAG: hypothetical protein ACFC03_00145 [Candidatus Malihini olakiniferum]